MSNPTPTTPQNAATPTGTTGTTGLGSSPRREFISSAQGNVNAPTYQQGFKDGQDHQRQEADRQAMAARVRVVADCGPALQGMSQRLTDQANFTNPRSEALSDFLKGYQKGVRDAKADAQKAKEAAEEPPTPEEACQYVMGLALDVGLSLKNQCALAYYFAAAMKEDEIE